MTFGGLQISGEDSEKQPQVHFDFAQCRLSTSLRSAQDDGID